MLSVVLILLIIACSEVPEDPAWFQSTESGKVLSKDDLITRVNAIDDRITIYRMQEEYLRRGGASTTVKDAMEQRWQQLLADQTPLGSPCEEVDLIAFDYRRIDTNRYRADYLFRIKHPLKTDLRIALYGVVAPEHIDRLSENRRKVGKKSEVWTLDPSPPSSAWIPGSYVFISQTFLSHAIPYNMSMVFYDPTRKPGQYGEPVQLGWRRGVTEDILLRCINDVDTLIDLYRLEGDCDNLPVAQKAFKEKSIRLLEKTVPLGKICDEADLIAFDYRMIGENRYRIDYIFRINRFLDRDCLVTLYGVVDENHRDLISRDRKQQGKTSEAWSFQPHPPTRSWPKGECVLVSAGIEAQAIPYNMLTILFDQETRRQHGNQVHLGWRADLGEPGSENN